ncbi:hypothetical protein [Xanthomonas campestris]|uniref:hypothetical protein n=1 Tax=Xanthomonas campestris TaxID=339 RepID=UPI0023796952|nr:hypothetical protein [Xanthomonas campestris]WDL17351.1 hypothetical protein JH285_19275 [Xanthomonas campestris pv. campestris]WDL21434.1 hypothetical protein JH268_19270 [Xanthomonas campestris pv. campestris]WDL26486.1 hypothetical protein JH276_02510 [Xanthomonas campestris pv. campestris]WDL29606.1 hypothetical protein JH297_19310 [Xanthomonas campestris pv. campestris]WDL34667.1 hypothetical protein JH255_02520 [Xanthomonas campestris pv. campestris]
MLHFIELLLLIGYVNLPIRFWFSVRKFGSSRFNEALRGDAHMFCLDIVAMFFALVAFYWIAHEALGVSIPGIKNLASWEAEIVAFVLTAACIALAFVNGRQRFLDATRAGMPEAALRWLATRQIIVASEVSAALTQVPHSTKRM